MNAFAAAAGTGARDASTGMGGAIEVELVPGAPAAISNVAAAADPRHIFLRSGWFEAAGAAGLRSLVARRFDGPPVAVLPVARQRLVVQAVPGSYWPFRSFPVASDAREGELAALLSDPSARRALGMVWRLGPVREDDPTAERILPIARQCGWTVVTRELGTAFVLDLAALRKEGSWPRTATLRKNRWIERKLAEHGDLEFRHHAGRAWTADLFDTLAGIERNSWIGSRTDGSDAKFMAPAHRHFWESAAGDPEIADRMHASLLLVGGRPAAFNFFLSAGSTLFFIANSYDEQFRKQSPGRVLLYRDFQRAFDEGIDLIDWGAGDGGYKSEMGARPGPAILDHLLVRYPLLAPAVRRFWRG